MSTGCSFLSLFPQSLCSASLHQQQANACQRWLELGGDRTKPSPSDGFSHLLAGGRLGFPTLEGSIYRESWRDFTRKNMIFIDRKTALKPQEKIHRHSEDIFCHLKKLDYLGGCVCDCPAILFHLQFCKNFWALFVTIFHVISGLVLSMED